MLTKPVLLLLAIIVAVYCLQNQLISSPFDNFRIECAKSSGAVRISVRMVGSQGFIRQDIVFAIVCERVDELYPWYGIPMGIAEMEREDCYYSQLFDPVVDTESSYTCRPREYISGVTRLSDTRVQLLCCRLRTRDEANCEEKQFSKPIGSDPRTEIFDSNKLINSIAVEGHSYRVRFCDLTPRAVGLIYEDMPTTTTTTTEIPKHGLPTASETQVSKSTTTTARKRIHTKNGRWKTPGTTTVSPAKKRVIRIFRPSALYNFGEQDQRTWDLNSSPPLRDSYPKGAQPYSQKDIGSKRDAKSVIATTTSRSLPTIPPDLERDYHVDDRGLLTEIDSLLEAQQTSEKELSAHVDEIAKAASQNRKAHETSKQNSVLSTTSSTPTDITEERRNSALPPHRQAQNQSAFKDANSVLLASTTEPVRNFATSSPRTTTSASLILLKPLSPKAKYSRVTSTDKQSTAKVYTRQWMNQELNPMTSKPSLESVPRTTTTPYRREDSGPATHTISVSSRQLYSATTRGGYVDEETSYSPFEDDNYNPSHDNEAIEKENSMVSTTIDPLDVISPETESIAHKFSNEIRRAPINSPRKQIGAAYSEFKGFPSNPTNKLDNEFNFPTFGDENTDYKGDAANGMNADYTDNEFPMKKSADGSRTYVPEDQGPMKAPSTATVFDNSKKQNVSGSGTKKLRSGKGEVQGENDVEEKHESSPWNDDVNEELLPMNGYKVDLVSVDAQHPSSESTSTEEQENLEFFSANFSQTQLTDVMDVEQPRNADEDADSRYDPAKFYHTPLPKRPPPTEKVLTFCTKEVAIRDRHNLVIACGGETEIWRPFRCPAGSECFLSADSNYRICCAVAEAVRYAQ